VFAIEEAEGAEGELRRRLQKWIAQTVELSQWRDLLGTKEVIKKNVNFIINNENKTKNKKTKKKLCCKRLTFDIFAGFIFAGKGDIEDFPEDEFVEVDSSKDIRL